MTSIVDRRGQRPGDGGAVSRDRFVQRNKAQVKKAIDKAIGKGNITDIGKGGVDVTIPRGDVNEPVIHHGSGGITERVFPGNEEFRAGDRIPKPPGGGGGGNGKGSGNQASEDGEGEDDFVFHISEEEFLNYLFDDLELPNLNKRSEADSSKTKPKRAGFTSDGAPSQLDLVRSIQKRKVRLKAADAPHNKKILALLEEAKEILSAYDDGVANTQDEAQGFLPRHLKIKKLDEEVTAMRTRCEKRLSAEDTTRLDEIDDEIEGLQKKKRLTPKWNESTDLRYRRYDQKPVPISKAVMFCLMDVSASMDQERKDTSKLFYFMLYQFLKRHYQQTDIVFIRHTQTAEEVDEKEFFYGKHTGGTKVSSALEKMQEIMAERYPENEWNIYGAQSSDGDNWGNDNILCMNLMREILPKVQGYFYTELPHFQHQELWHAYEKLAGEFSDRFWIGEIGSRKDIWPLFREFFKKRGEVEASPSSPTSALAPR